MVSGNHEHGPNPVNRITHEAHEPIKAQALLHAFSTLPNEQYVFTIRAFCGMLSTSGGERHANDGTGSDPAAQARRLGGSAADRVAQAVRQRWPAHHRPMPHRRPEAGRGEGHQEQGRVEITTLPAHRIEEVSQ